MSDTAIDAAYNVRAAIAPDLFDRIIAAYRTESLAATQDLTGESGIVYDQQSGEQLDIWGMGSAPRPVVIAIHGGYWRMLSRHDTAFMAAVLADAGVATVSVDYTLAPAATLEEIVRQIRSAIAWVYRNAERYRLDRDRIFVTGSSAGGHLAAVTAVGGWQASLKLPANVVKGVMPLSGLFDLRPLVDSFANEWLALDRQRAAALSPMLEPPTAGVEVVSVVAEHDGTGFLFQSLELERQWSHAVSCRHMVVPGTNHYDLFLQLADPASPATKLLLELVSRV